MSLQELSPMEVFVLSLIYEHPEADVYQILEAALKQGKDWKYTTVLTLCTRLFDKGHVEKKKNGKRYLYLPKFSRADSFRMIMNRMFGDTILKDPACSIQYILKSKKWNAKQKKSLDGLFKRL